MNRETQMPPSPTAPSAPPATPPHWLSRLPVPLFLVQPVLTRIVRHVARSQPALFERLGEHCGKTFLIDAQELPFMLSIQPLPEAPKLNAVPRGAPGTFDVKVRAPFGTLLDMIDTRADSDALFFNRNLHISGDTEAVVALRNALDDMDNSLVDEVLEVFGPLRGPLRHAVTKFENRHG